MHSGHDMYVWWLYFQKSIYAFLIRENMGGKFECNLKGWMGSLSTMAEFESDEVDMENFPEGRFISYNWQFITIVSWFRLHYIIDNFSIVVSICKYYHWLFLKLSVSWSWSLRIPCLTQTTMISFNKIKIKRANQVLNFVFLKS